MTANPADGSDDGQRALGLRDAAALAETLSQQVDDLLRTSDAELLARYPGDRPGRQAVHTVYVSGDLFHADLASAWGRSAQRAIDDHRELFATVAGAPQIVDLVHGTLRSEPIEDLRIDFEDGYGDRGDAEEDADVQAAAAALAGAAQAGTAPPYRGIRFKSLEAPTRRRGLRTLTLFVSHLLERGGTLEDFVVTLPKITSVDQVKAMVEAIAGIEQSHGIEGRALRFELQIETPQSILGPDGTALVARMIHAGDGRVTALHYGTYDYSAFCSIPAAYQSMEHPVADHAKQVMQVAAAGTGVRLSDGSTNVLPVGDEDTVRHGWELHARLVRRSLERGYYQGWDLHPAQLPTRFAATYAFYRAGFDEAARRLRTYTSRAESSVMDEPATARALADFVLRGVECGAIADEESSVATGLEPSDLVALARPPRMM